MKRIVGPFNVISGQSTQINGPTPQGTQSEYAWLTVYNNTNFIQEVNSETNQAFLQPFTANVFRVPSGIGISLTPVAGQYPIGVWLGTVTAEYNSDKEEKPEGFPVPINQFPGGAQLLATYPVPSQIPLGPLGPIIAVSPGIGTLIIQLAVLGATSISVVGVQSGITYATLAVSVSGTYSVNLTPNLQDYELQINGQITVRASIVALYEAPGPAIPTQPNLIFHGSVANGGTVLPALTSGAYYIFGIDSLTAAQDIQNFTGNGVAAFASTNTAVGTAALCQGTTGYLAAIRVSTAIAYTATAVAQADLITIRYAIGP